jgi:hypothetical protein
MECPGCGASLKTTNTRTWQKPGRGNDASLSEASLLSGTRYFTYRVRICDGCGWSGETLELTMEHLQYLLKEAGRTLDVEMTEITLQVTRTPEGKYLSQIQKLTPVGGDGKR